MAEEIKQNETPKEEQSVVERANELAERMEKANAKAEELLRKREEQYAKEKLGGRTSINASVPVTKPKSYKEQCLDAVKDLEENKFNPFK